MTMTANMPQKRNNLLLSLFSRQLVPDKSPLSSVQNPCHRPLIRKAYRRASSNARKVYRTQYNANSLGEDINPVYEIAYSPVVHQDYRIIAVADELGYLSIVKVGFGGNGWNKRREGRGGGSVEEGGEYSGPIVNLGFQFNSPALAALGARRGDNFRHENNSDEGEPVLPVLNNVAWNPDGRKILAGYGDGSVRIWDLNKDSKPCCIFAMRPFEKSLKRVAWCDETLISCSRTNEILVHDRRMRNPLTNRIDCSLLNSKLTDICVVSDVNIVASSSNHSSIHLFDLRYSYKLYKKLRPVESFNLSSPGYTTMKYDNLANDGLVYALGSDSIIRSFDYRTGDVSTSYKVPGRVDFFTKIDVDRFSGILISGSCDNGAYGFDLDAKCQKGCEVKPFFECKEGKKVNLEDDPSDYDENTESDKENLRVEGSINETENRRCCCAVAIGTRRGYQDCAFQIACGGDNSTVVVYD